MLKKKNSITLNEWLRTGLIRICRIHFVFVAVYIAYTIASDVTKLITPQLVLQRWTMSAILLTVTGTIWYLARNSNIKGNNYYKSLLYALIITDLAMATFNIYTQRGMSSRAVALFAIPIIVSAILLSRTAIFLVATLAATMYSLASVKYFVDYFNEGYKAELYIEVGLYCCIFYILATLLTVIIRFNNTETEHGL